MRKYWHSSFFILGIGTFFRYFDIFTVSKNDFFLKKQSKKLLLNIFLLFFGIIS